MLGQLRHAGPGCFQWSAVHDSSSARAAVCMRARPPGSGKAGRGEARRGRHCVFWGRCRHQGGGRQADPQPQGRRRPPEAEVRPQAGQGRRCGPQHGRHAGAAPARPSGTRELPASAPGQQQRRPPSRPRAQQPAVPAGSDPVTGLPCVCGGGAGGSAGNAVPVPGQHDPSEPTYCICKNISYGEMISCDNEVGGLGGRAVRWVARCRMQPAACSRRDAHAAGP